MKSINDYKEYLFNDSEIINNSPKCSIFTCLFYSISLLSPSLEMKE